jgi:glyoxylase-like metal-dependent hydrolase (beta-lactamase superfamily II)
MSGVQVADRIHRLTQGVVNFYLIDDGGKLTLVDAGALRDSFDGPDPPRRRRGREDALGKNEAGYGRYLLRIEAYRTLFGLMRRGGLKIVPVHEVSTFEDGETLDVPGRPRVVHAPGHTEGNCSS